MKRKFLVVFTGLVLVLSLASVAGAVLGFSNPGEFCNMNGNMGLSHDACVVCVNKGNNNHTCLCKIFEFQGLLQFFGFANFGDCVSTFARM